MQLPPDPPTSLVPRINHITLQSITNTTGSRGSARNNVMNSMSESVSDESSARVYHTMSDNMEEVTFENSSVTYQRGQQIKARDYEDSLHMYPSSYMSSTSSGASNSERRHTSPRIDIDQLSHGVSQAIVKQSYSEREEDRRHLQERGNQSMPSQAIVKQSYSEREEDRRHLQESGNQSMPSQTIVKQSYSEREEDRKHLQESSNQSMPTQTIVKQPYSERAEDRRHLQGNVMPSNQINYYTHQTEQNGKSMAPREFTLSNVNDGNTKNDDTDT